MDGGHPTCDNLDVPSPAVSAAPAWANRIVGHGEEAPDQLLANPANYRVHPKAQQEAWAGVLDQVGWVQNVLVNQRTDHVVDGHLRVALAISRGCQCRFSTSTSPRTRSGWSLASLDPLAAMATTDEAKLRELLAEVSVDSEALAAMLARKSTISLNRSRGGWRRRRCQARRRGPGTLRWSDAPGS